MWLPAVLYLHVGFCPLFLPSFKHGPIRFVPHPQYSWRSQNCISFASVRGREKNHIQHVVVILYQCQGLMSKVLNVWKHCVVISPTLQTRANPSASTSTLQNGPRQFDSSESWSYILGIVGQVSLAKPSGCLKLVPRQAQAHVPPVSSVAVVALSGWGTRARVEAVPQSKPSPVDLPARQVRPLSALLALLEIFH